MSFHKILFATLLILAFSFVISSHNAAAQEKHVAIRLLPEKTQARGGETITVGIEQTIAKGWHTYWINPGDSGTAARIVWKGTDDIRAEPVQWPAPHKLPMGPLVNFGYENKVVLLQDIVLPGELPQGPVTLSADIDILVCHDICIPESHTASFILNGDQKAVQAEVEIARTKLPLDVGWNTKIKEENGNLIVTMATDTPGAFAKQDRIELYPEEWGLILNPGQTNVTTNDTGLVLSHPRGERGLDDAPVSKIVIAYEDGAGVRKAIRLSAMNEAMPAATVVPNENVGFAQAFLLALLGGLILNLMPCVFPVLSMKALSLVSLKDKDIKKARVHGITYTLGILVSFAVIAGVLIALKASGAQIGWGFQLQNPAIILSLAYLFFLLGLNLSGYFEINFGLSNAGASLTQKSGATGSFFTGVLATLVATPCTAPFMGVAMGYALTQPAVVSLAVFMALGLGLALPYLILTFVPALRHYLPRPGHWMETFRQFLAFPMFASSCWLIWVLSQQTDHMGVFIALLGMLSLTFAIWLFKSRPAKGFWKGAVKGMSLVFLVFTMSTLVMDRHLDPVKTEIAAQEGDNWEAFSQQKLDTYLDGGNAVFINMTAAWCITCKVNEKVALSVPATKKLFLQNNVKYLKGDWTNQNPEITNFLEQYGRSGVPLYVYYAPRNEESGIRPDAVLLPQILTPSIVEDALTHTGDQTP